MPDTFIKSEAQYKKYLDEVEMLVEEDPSADSPEGERLSLLSLAIHNFEVNRYFFHKPSPVEAIRFRMEEKGLKQNDLVPFMGSKSKVSEILAGKRSLTLPMIRALNMYLGIPLSVLVQEERRSNDKVSLTDIDWAKFPISEMKNRNWISKKTGESISKLKQIISAFLQPMDSHMPQDVMWRRTLHNRTADENDWYSLLAWSARVMSLANEETTPKYDASAITKDFLRGIAKLSQFEQGPLLAREMLSNYGIKLIIEKHLPRTKLDGGCFMGLEGNPIIGLTLRFDRLDNFWFTLLHELAHVYKHLGSGENVYFDDVEKEPISDLREREADKLTREVFIPRTLWKRSDAFVLQTEKAILEFAKELNINPAIVAGRIRYESKNYSRFHKLLGQGKVRNLFGVK